MTGRREKMMRTLCGAAALAVLGALGAFLPARHAVRCPAFVESSRVFTLSSADPTLVRCFLTSGASAGGPRLLSQRVIQFERSDLVRLEVVPSFGAGDEIREGTLIARVVSLRNGRRLEELSSAVEALDARQELLSAGSTREAVEEASRRVALARAMEAAARTELSRMESLYAHRLASDAEMDAIRQEVEVQRLQTEVAEAELATERGSARPEALAEIDAERDALLASIAELQALKGEEEILSPISGLAELSLDGSELRIHAVETIYLKVPVPVADRERISLGAPAVFTSEAVPGGRFIGEVADRAPGMAMVGERWVQWVSVRVANPDRRLRRGMVGEVTFGAPRGGRLFQASFPGDVP